jgi:FkbM family methyltransferase
MPGSMEPFKKLRPEDINLEAAISDSAQVLTYYMFNEPALNGFSAEVTAELDLSRWQLLEKRPIKTQTLAEVLDLHMPPGQKIDFLTIDVEGLDYQVLVSNDWKKYRPRLVLVEELKTTLSELSYLESASKVASLMQENNYKLLAKTFNTSFYQIKS